MNRRKFIVKGLFAGVLIPPVFSESFGFSPTKDFTNAFSFDFDQAILSGGEPGLMFEKGIVAIGGMKKFIKKNQRVTIKPNIGWDAIPEKGANTNPQLVASIIKECFKAGAKEVFVFDHTSDPWQKCYLNSGIEKAVKEAGGKLIHGHEEKMYQTIDIPKGKILKTAKVHELVLTSDVVINVPVLKNHCSVNLSMGMKNMMGMVWNRRYWHENDLNQCIADFSTLIKPALTIIDAYRVITTNGPRGLSRNDVVVLKKQIISSNPLAADMSAANLMAVDPTSIGYIRNFLEINGDYPDLSKLKTKMISF